MYLISSEKLPTEIRSSLASEQTPTFESRELEARQRLSTKKFRCFKSLSGVSSLKILGGRRTISFSEEISDATDAEDGTRNVVMGSDDRWWAGGGVGTLAAAAS